MASLLRGQLFIVLVVFMEAHTHRQRRPRSTRGSVPRGHRRPGIVSEGALSIVRRCTLPQEKQRTGIIILAGVACG